MSNPNNNPNPSLAYECTFAAMIGLFTNIWHTATDERLREAIAKISQITGLAEGEQPGVFADLRKKTTFFEVPAAHS